MTDALAGYGALLKVGDGGTVESFTTIGEVRDISGPGMSATMKEVTSHDSGGWAEQIPTVLKGGDVTFTVNFVPSGATHDHETGLIADWMGRVKRNYQLVWPDGATTYQFAAYVSGVEPSAPVEDEIVADVTLSITGAIDFDK